MYADLGFRKSLNNGCSYFCGSGAAARLIAAFAGACLCFLQQSLFGGIQASQALVSRPLRKRITGKSLMQEKQARKHNAKKC